jgi:hypothetical protein
MKKLILFLFLAINSISHCQWEPDVRLTNSVGNSVIYRRNIAANGNILHVVWSDARNGNHEIYYRRSTNAGVTWEAEIRLTNKSADSYSPSIAVSGSTVHVVWEDTRDGYSEIYYKRSINDGTSWGADRRLTNANYSSRSPSVVVSGFTVHIVWTDGRNVGTDIYYKRSIDAGTSWEADIALIKEHYVSQSPEIAVSGLTVHVVWEDDRNLNFEIYYKRSTNGGLNWSSDTRLTNHDYESKNPFLGIYGSIIHLVWYDYRDFNYEIYYKRSTNGGINWSADTRLTNNPASSLSPVVGVSGSVVLLFWYDDRDANQEIYYKRSTNGGINWSADTRLTNYIASSLFPSVAISGTAVHVVWEDARHGDKEVYYKRNPTAVPIGIKPLNTEIPKEFKLYDNYPNPFNPTTNIQYDIAKNGLIKLVIFDILGKKIQTLVNENQAAGTYRLIFDASQYASGVYFYKLETENYVKIKKMVVLK